MSRTIRNLLLLLALPSLLAPLVSAGELYKCKGDSGETVFSDQPCPGGETLPMKETPTYEALPPPAPLPPLNTKGKQAAQIAYQLSLVSPEPEAVIRDNEGKVEIAGRVAPTLNANHRFRLLLDGQPVGDLQKSASWSLDNVDRGEHTLVLEVVDKDSGKAMASATGKFVLFRASANKANPNGANLSVLPTANGWQQRASWPQQQDAPQPGDPTPSPPTKPSHTGPRK